MKCNTCGRELINYGGKIYLHPPEVCQEKDGYELHLVDAFLASKFKEKYKNPKIDMGMEIAIYEQTISDYKMRWEERWNWIKIWKKFIPIKIRGV